MARAAGEARAAAARSASGSGAERERQREGHDLSQASRCCAVSECVALATRGMFCSAHVNMRKEAFNVTCRLCSRTIKAGKWHHYEIEGVRCAPQCKERTKAEEST